MTTKRKKREETALKAKRKPLWVEAKLPDWREIIAAPSQKAEEIMQSLTLREQLSLILQAPWEVRERLIILSKQADRLVKALPPQEFFWTVKALSPEEAVTLLSMASPTQLQFLFDLDCWHKDRLVLERVLAWLTLMFEASEDVVARWLKQVDFDFLTTLMKRLTEVYKRPDGVDLTEARDWLPPYTLDDMYFINFRLDKFEPLTRRLVEILMEIDPARYRDLMESIIWELPGEVEEMAYRWRRARLADWGVPDYYESLDVYAPQTPDRMRQIDPLYLPAQETEETPPPAFLPAIHTEGVEFFTKVLSGITDWRQIDRLKRELAWLVNKVLIVDIGNIDDIEEARGVFDKVAGYLNIGLEYLSRKNPTEAKHILETYFLEDIFRVAQKLISDLRRYAHEIITQENVDPRIFRHLDEPYASYLKGVTANEANRIMLFLPEKTGTAEEFRPFRSLAEIERVRRVLSEIAYWAPLIQQAFGVPPVWLAEIALKKTNLIEPGDIRWSTLILTALANWLVNESFKFEAVPESLWPSVIEKLLTKKGTGERSVIKEKVKEDVFENFKRLAKEVAPLEEDHLRSFLNFCFFRAEEEFAFADKENIPEPRYVQCMLIELAK
ncbi:DUF6178 family protein [Thermodesulfatator atlanticus]|uniref:DUF6178 family protein n=1 Tax=Thermodesulfatator atlanticus TaxID=501497 RepID=UPI0003B4ED2E|nr:DUF6178 family protein [Thermodesulfatator atlanticus]